MGRPADYPEQMALEVIEGSADPGTAQGSLPRFGAGGDSGGVDQRPIFQWRRSILKSPDWYARLSALLREKYPNARVEVVDPYTFFGLIKLHLSPPGGTGSSRAVRSPGSTFAQDKCRCGPHTCPRV